MKTRIALFGALRDADASGCIELDVPAGCTVAQLREQLVTHLHAHAPAIGESLVRRSAFGTCESILHDSDTVPADTELAVLPPVGGG